MTGFKPIRYDSGKLDTKTLATSQVITKGMALVDDGNGLLAAASSGATFVPYVAMETITSTSDTPQIQVIRTNGVEFEATTAGTPAQTDEEEFCDLTSSTVVNEAASSNDVFVIQHLLNAATKTVSGYFVQKVS